ncbi:hypothetical protein JH06_4148 [Blastocystis sp. subtype 4]|uniref:hypothetical protein n=1 Tax=Blastocystis sp. subtype 4 TaxID=944170 RepID=UPI000711FA4D|nr:hypothetical protein JH06_4148 [Blastocystis sp. subtype 4]KNB42252.1 hypothetical protein JH06_4148 [Blastocystis sp. subtype 4]|eukprot:XP_014525695.1 hypothetical protein JH06_4148 [Blastocystis sp. subtype 4]
MIDYFCIFTTTGLILWSKSFCELTGNPVNKMVKEMILAERSNEKQFTDGPYMLKWTLSNDLGLVFVVVYQRILQLMYTDDLLASVKRAFTATFEDRFPIETISEFDFDDQFTQILDAAESVSQRVKKPTLFKGSNLNRLKRESTENIATDSLASEEPVSSDTESRDEDAPHSVPKYIKRKGNKKGASEKKQKKSKFLVTEDDQLDMSSLDRSVGGEAVTSDVVENFNESEMDRQEETTTSSWGLGKLGGFFKRLTGETPITEDELTPVVDSLKKKLVEKNVATEIAEAICGNVKEKLLGKKLGGFTRVTTVVRDALEESIESILTTKSSIDILRRVQEYKQQNKTFSIVFCGVNGVGKSTSLSKVAYYFKSKGLRVLLAACDTYRSGAVEQLRVHVDRLGLDLFERGYTKDPSDVAFNALKYANDNGFDVCLIDTAGRMQNNEGLMRNLVKLVNVNNPDLILFVGEALVGNDGVDQLKEFNRALHDLSDLPEPRTVDGIVLTKFDTIDDKVGAALSMVYCTGKPIVFVGTGQKYTNLKRLNVKDVVNLLLN